MAHGDAPYWPAIPNRLWTEPSVRRYLWDDEVITRARATLGAGIASFATHGFGGWLVRERVSTAVVGFCGLRLVEGSGDAPTTGIHGGCCTKRAPDTTVVDSHNPKAAIGARTTACRPSPLG